MRLSQFSLLMNLFVWVRAQNQDPLCSHDRQNYQGYYIDCQTGSLSDNLPDTGQPAASLDECIQRCSSNSDCVGVSHQNNVPDGSCYEFSAFFGLNPDFPDYDIAVKRSSGSAPAGIPYDIGYSYIYQNCYIDTQDYPAVIGSSYENDATTLAQCAQACSQRGNAGFLSMTFRQECFCGPSLNDTLGTGNGCTLTCSQDADSICGGLNYAQVYRRDGYVDAAASKTSVSISRASANAYLASSRSAANAAQSATRASVSNSKATYASVITSSREAYSRQQASIRASITSRRDLEASSRAQANAAIDSSRSLFYSSRQAARDSVTSARNAQATSLALANSLLASSRAFANEQKSATRESVLASKSARDAQVVSTKASVSLSRSRANAAIEATRASVASSKSARTTTTRRA